MKSDSFPTVDSITQLDLSLAREHLSDALHNYISAAWLDQLKWPQANSSPLPSNFACLILCQSVCAGRSEEKCISLSTKSSPEARELLGAVTLGRLLNAERALKCSAR